MVPLLGNLRSHVAHDDSATKETLGSMRGQVSDHHWLSITDHSAHTTGNQLQSVCGPVCERPDSCGLPVADQDGGHG